MQPKHICDDVHKGACKAKMSTMQILTNNQGYGEMYECVNFCAIADRNCMHGESSPLGISAVESRWAVALAATLGILGHTCAASSCGCCSLSWCRGKQDPSQNCVVLVTLLAFWAVCAFVKQVGWTMTNFQVVLGKTPCGCHGSAEDRQAAAANHDS